MFAGVSAPSNKSIITSPRLLGGHDELAPKL